ncbi:TPA: hypothetical protein ACKPYU_000821 [Stenotrophomonas maltophilia]
MDAIEKRARELLAAEYERFDLPGTAAVVRNGEYDLNPSMRALVAALTPPEGYVLVPVELPDIGDAPGFAEGHYSRSSWQAAIADLQWLAARPEVP